MKKASEILNAKDFHTVSALSPGHNQPAILDEKPPHFIRLLSENIQSAEDAIVEFSERKKKYERLLKLLKEGQK